MARKRLLSPGFFDNQALAACSAHARLLFAGLWTLADREGRMKCIPFQIHGLLFPYESSLVEEHQEDGSRGRLAVPGHHGASRSRRRRHGLLGRTVVRPWKWSPRGSTASRTRHAVHLDGTGVYTTNHGGW